MLGNLMKLFNTAPAGLVEAGVSWYHDVRKWCHVQAAEFGITPWMVAAVIAAHSPRVNWERNLSLARSTMVIWKGGGSLTEDAFQLPTLKGSIARAWKVLEGEITELNGPKTSAFCDNIAVVESVKVTVDIWAARAALHDLDVTYKTVRKYLEGNYDEFENAYLEGADLVGLRGYEFQAAVWLWVRQLGNQAKNLKQLSLV